MSVPAPPNPKVRSVEETFSRVLGKEDKEGEKMEGGVGEKTNHSSFKYFCPFFFIIMTHVYNTKYLDQEQGCRDTNLHS